MVTTATWISFTNINSISTSGTVISTGIFFNRFILFVFNNDVKRLLQAAAVLWLLAAGATA